MNKTKSEIAVELFKSGLNCSQSVAAAFADEINMDEDDIKRLTIGFGGGVGRLREVCGAVSGMTFIISALYGDEGRASVYKRVQTVADEFKSATGSIVCRELLGIDADSETQPIPEKRTDEYYKKRPCAELVGISAKILEDYIKSN